MNDKQIRLRDFIEDRDGCLYAVSNYDNRDRVGCILRYVPDPAGERANKAGQRFRKYDFEEAFDWIRAHKPQYLDMVHRVSHEDIRRVYKPEVEVPALMARDPRVRRLAGMLGLSPGTFGCTGSLLCCLENAASDIDLVVYGNAWFSAQQALKKAVKSGQLPGMSEEMWRKVYTKRVPEISYEAFILHEQRKWNRGEIGGTYFDLLYTRSYDMLDTVPAARGTVLDRRRIEATVSDASLSFDSPAVYTVEHEEISRVLSFTHTYSGQALAGETIEAAGVCERHGEELWLVVGTTREARGEYIISRTLMESS